jgi:HlyD family secretion protein
MQSAFRLCRMARNLKQAAPMAMDKALEKKKTSLRQWLVMGAAAAFALVVAWQVLSRTGSSRLAVDSTRVTTALVRRGEFLEYYPFDGTVEPATSVYLDVDEGGRVDEILAEGGTHVEKGDLILRFSNATMQRTAIDTETQLLENLNIQRDAQFNRAQSGLLLKETLLDLDHQILDMQNKHRRYEALMKDGSNALSQEAFETTRDQLQYLRDRRALMAERIRQEDILSTNQITQAKTSIERLNASMELLDRIVKSLEVRAPISGYLSTIDAQVGQNIPRGQRIGQIDLLGKFKVRMKIDQFYIARVEIGTAGHLNLDGRDYEVKVQKVYPEVRQNTFEADVVFVAAVPDTLKRGQTLTVELSFGSPSKGLTVSKGGYFQQTAGKWVYLVAADGRTARRVSVRLGRQNPREVEVLEGLNEGDRIVSSSYETYNDTDELKFSDSIKAKQDRS